MERVVFASSRAAAIAVHVLLALYCAVRCTAARPLLGGPQTSESALALPPDAAAVQLRSPADYDDAAARTGKWMPFEGGAGAAGFVAHHHLPAAYWAHKPMPWVGLGPGAHGGGSSGAFEGGGRAEAEEEEELVPVRDRQRSYERGDADTTTTNRQEQLAMWASLLYPKGKRREGSGGWLPAPEVEDRAGGGAQVVGQQTESAGLDDWRNNGN